MIKDLLKYLMMFAILIVAQLLVFNNIEFSGYVNPYVYVLFILMLPFEIPRLVQFIEEVSRRLRRHIRAPGIQITKQEFNINTAGINRAQQRSAAYDME